MPFQQPSLNLTVISPVLLIIAWGILLMIVDLFVPKEKKQLTGWLSAVGLVLALLYSFSLWGEGGGAFTVAGGEPMLLVDDYATFLNGLFLLTGILTVLISVSYLEKMELHRGEYYMLMLFSISGMMLMGMANDLILVFLALELLSIPLYILAGFARPRPDSEESAMKYFLLGAFSSSFLVFGIALIYGAVGSTSLPVVLANIGDGGMLGVTGVALALVGFAFKVGAVPFHMWTPDVYEGAPTSVTAFMSVGAKVGGFAAMIRLFIVALPDLSHTWVPVMSGIAMATMIVGNVVALAQPNVKRMLAYSSIAHAGYIMMGVAAAAQSIHGVSASLFYMMAYLFTNLGVFAIVTAVEQREGKGLLLDDYKGLARRRPLMALAMSYFMLSLIGIPLTGGFSGKFFIFRAALESGLYWVALVGVITSVVSGYFYLRVVYLMYMFDGEGEVNSTPALNTAIVLTVIATLILGFLPGHWFELAQEAVLSGARLLAGG